MSQASKEHAKVECTLKGLVLPSVATYHKHILQDKLSYLCVWIWTWQQIW